MNFVVNRAWTDFVAFHLFIKHFIAYLDYSPSMLPTESNIIRPLSFAIRALTKSTAIFFSVCIYNVIETLVS